MAGESSRTVSRRDKGKEKAAADPSMEEMWLPSSTTKQQVEGLVTAGLLPPKKVSHWKVPQLGTPAPTEEKGEVTVLRRYFEVGLGLPAHPFFRGLLVYWGIQAHHLSLNSYLHIAIFIHFCEAFIGIEPHFALFLAFFRLKSILKGKDSKYLGGAGLQFKQGMQNLYVPYELKDTYKNWEREWFTVADPEPSLPPRKAEYPVSSHCWSQGKAEMGEDEVEVLQTIVADLREAGLTGARVFMDFLQKKIQPLQVRPNPSYLYLGKEDPSRLVKEDLDEEEALRIVSKYIKGVNQVPPEVHRYDATNPPEQVNFDNLSRVVIVGRSSLLYSYGLVFHRTGLLLSTAPHHWTSMTRNSGPIFMMRIRLAPPSSSTACWIVQVHLLLNQVRLLLMNRALRVLSRSPM